MTPKRKVYEINIGLKVHGFANVQTMRTIFHREYNPSDGMYMEKTPRIDLKATHHNGDNWQIFVQYEATHKYVTSQVDTFRAFLRGVHATMFHLQDITTL